MNLSPVRPALFALYFFLFLSFLFFFSFFPIGRSFAQELVIQRGDQELFANYKFDEKEERLFSWGPSGHSVRMWDAGTGRLVDEFYLDNAAMIVSMTFSDSSDRLACTSLGNIMQVWDVRKRESVTVPLEFGDMWVQARGSQFLVFSTDRVKLFDVQDLSLQRTITLRKRASPTAMIGVVNNIYHYKEGWVVVSMDSVSVYDGNFAFRKRWPMAIDGPKPFVNSLAFDERRHALVLYDINQQSFALLDVESGALSYKTQSGVLSGASFFGEHFLLLDPVGVSPRLMDLGNGKLVDVEAKLPQGKGLRKLFGNDRWLVCSQQLSLFGNSEKDRVFAFINPNTLETMFRDTVETDEVVSYVTALGKRHFAYSTTDRSMIGRVSNSPRIYDLQYDNLTDPVPPALNTLSAVYARQLMMPDGSLKQQLQAGIFRNFNRQNEPSGVFFSPQYHYLLMGGLGEKLLKKRIGDSLVLVKKMDWSVQPVGFADFTPDERYLLVKRDSVVEVVRTADGAILSSLKLAHQIFLGSFCSDNAHAWVIGDPFKVDLLDLKTLNWSSLTFPWAVSSMVRVDSLNYVACTSNGIYTVNVATREIKPLLNNHKTLAITSDPLSQKLYTLMDDGTVRVTNLKDRGTTSLSDGSSDADLSLTWGDVGAGATIFQHFFLSYDRRYLVTHTRDDQIRVWDLVAGKVIFRVKLAGINVISMDSKRHLLIALTQTQIGTSQDEVRVFDLQSGATVFSSVDEVRKIRQHPPAAISDLVGASIAVSSPSGTSQMSRLTYKQVRVDPDLHYLWMLSGQMVGLLNLWDLRPMNWSRTAKEFLVDGFRDSLAMVRTYGWTGFVNPVTRDTTGVPFGPESYIPFSGHFPGYSYAIKQRYDKDKGVLYDFKLYGDRASRLLLSHRMATEIVDVTASPDGKFVATSTDYEHAYPDTAFLFDAASGGQAAARAGVYYRTFFTPDNRYWVCLVHGKPTPVFDLAKKEWRMIDLDGVDVQPMAGGHLVKSGGKLVDLENAQVYQTNLTVLTEVSNGRAYGLTLSGEAGVYQLATNTFKNFSFQQTGGFNQAWVSPDKHFLITLGFDGFVTKWDLQTGLLAAQAPIDYEPQRTIYFNTDSTFVVTINAYKAVTFSLKTLHPKYTFAPGDNGMLNYFLADGSYFVDRSDLNNYYFNYQGGLFGYTQFDLHFNRPDKVLAALDVKQPVLIQQYHDAVLKRLPNQTIPNFDVANLHAPEIRVLNERRLPPKVSVDTITVAVEAEDVRSPLAALRVMINGNPVSAGHWVGSADGKKIEGRLLLHLGEGHNRIDLSCINTDGVASLVKSVEINCATVRPAPKTYYVGIGLDHYLMSQQLPRLNFSRKDIHALGSLLAMGGPVIVDTLCDRQVTAKAIDSLLQRLSGIGIDDKVVVFFSGHGLRVGADFFLSTYKVDPVHPAGLGYNFSRMEKFLAAIPARQKLVLIDACNSGQSDQDQSVNDDPYAAIDPAKKKATGYARSYDLMQDVFADVSSATGAMVICASRSTQFANEGKTNGVFTECLIRGIGGKEADGNGDRKITVEELKNYLITSVPKLSPDKQQPVTRGDIAGLDWPLIKLP